MALDLNSRPNRVPWPPLIGGAALALAVLAERAAPLGLGFGPAARWLGWALIVAGLGLDLWAMATMARAGVNILPHRAAGGLVAGGPFAFTRNPIYLGNTTALVGVGGAANSLWFRRRRARHGEARRGSCDPPGGKAPGASLRARMGRLRGARPTMVRAPVGGAPAPRRGDGLTRSIPAAGFRASRDRNAINRLIGVSEIETIGLDTLRDSSPRNSFEFETCSFGTFQDL